MVPEKVGLKTVQRDGLEYEFTLVFDLDIKNNASASKDRTGLFFGKPEFKLSPQTGKLLAQWCDAAVQVSAEDVIERIKACSSIKDLLSMYYQFPQFSTELKAEFEARKKQLQPPVVSTPDKITTNFSSNGRA